MTRNETDVLIIGGGPAGSTFATLLKQRGHDVTLLEQGHHPRFHIGESLLPMNLPILERLGVMPDIQAIGVPKPGADFTIGNSGDDECTFYFRDALGDSPPQAFEVRRSEFDQILFENARNSGAVTVEGMRVKEVIALGDARHEVLAEDENGEQHQWTTRFLVDASGRDTFMASANGWKSRNALHASAAVFGHFKNVARRAGVDDGNISLYWFEHGWFWMIPLRDDVMSVGAVCRPTYLKSRTGSLDEFLKDTMDSIEETRLRMVEAEVVVPAQATGNYSYASTRMVGPGYIMVGDAFAFIDPVFSSGVYLAMSSAERGMRVVESQLSGGRIKPALERWRYQRDTRRGLSTFSWFIYRFTSPIMSRLMSNPRNIFGVVQAVVSMLAGDVYSNRRVRRRLLVFKSIYYASSLRHWPEALEFRRTQMASARAPSQVTE